MRPELVLQTLVEDIMNSTLLCHPADGEGRSRILGNPKRYAAYFPSKASLYAKCTVEEEDSTWEYSAPAYPPSRNSSATSCTTSGSTPAQLIVMRYRSGQCTDYERPPSSPSSQYSELSSTTFESASSVSYEPVALEAQPAHRISRDVALFSTVSLLYTLFFVHFIDCRTFLSTRKHWRLQRAKGSRTGSFANAPVAVTCCQTLRP